ncbi:HlyD family efflux transporter periplasmic adaptor subunit (plasmid) [Rhizobium sullae]|uniref:HlyD family efflux transporter periplasmic adaptor subunit n=1 Tax=Rhizobium sullae TaxID=50338 RepID=A0ABY5XQV0_RHISU|nr:HlyD family efflux transporter periplasmic adaptor subunit [Rhizobium sullae]UWU16982.1 HlyD family efflux transporter periplasmic adaptor subunit [Rhizobium sullae]
MAVPMGWHATGYLMASVLVAVVLFLSIASYARIVTATGVILPDSGVAAVMPPRSGVVMKMMVHDGDLVKEAQELVAVRSEDYLVSGESASQKVAQMLARQNASITEQLIEVKNDQASQTAQFDAQIAGYRTQIEKLQNQIVLQRDLVASIEQDVERIRGLVDKGIVPKRDVLLREDSLTERRQQMAVLESTLTERRSDLSDAERMLDQVKARANEKIAALQSQREDINRSIAANEQSRAYVIRSPIAGTVSGLTAKIGEPLNAQQALMSIVPLNAPLHAQLDVPNAAVGFVEVGQAVRLAIDTFPYQSFGTIAGRVKSLSKSPVNRGNGTNTNLNYLVTVELERQSIMAFGKPQALFAGMTLSARIATARQSLLEWLFEPLFALQRR